MTDYMSEASQAVHMCKTRGSMSEREAMMQTLAKHLEALDTERTRADEAEKRERELREAVKDDPDWICAGIPDAVIEAGITAYSQCRDDLDNYVCGVTADWDEGMIVAAVFKAMLRTLIQPEPDPLVEAIEAMRQTAKELRECPNRDCNLVMQAIMWEKRAADVEARLSIVKGES